MKNFKENNKIRKIFGFPFFKKTRIIKMENIQKKSFYETRNTINSIQKYCGAFGIITISGYPEKITYPAYILGWIKATKFEDSNTYVLSPLKKVLIFLII